MQNIMKSIRRTGAAAALAVSLQVALPMPSQAQSRSTSRSSQPTPRPSAPRPSSPTPRTPAANGASNATREPAHTSVAPASRSETPSRPAPATTRENSRPATTTASRPSRVSVERPVAGRPGYTTRTYVAGGRSYVRVYRSYSFHGVIYQRYVPAFYFQPGFYSWVFNPWPGPVAFSWGYYSAPWYGYYGPYFAPAPIYRSPSLWLTDFLIAENLKAAYEAQQAGQGPADPDQKATITPEIKELISQQVRQELAAERKEAESNGSGDPNAAADVPPALDPTQRVFVVSMDLNVPVESDQTCALTSGDIILRTNDGDDGKVAVTVLSSKAGNCAVNTRTTVDLATLQEMHNDFRRQIDAGLAVLAQNQGKGGLPAGPAANPSIARDGQTELNLDAGSAVANQQQAASKNQ